jgi:diguanylate cyclase
VTTRKTPAAPARRLVTALLAAVVLFSTGTGPRPDGLFWWLAYDVVLYNAVYVLGALVCLTAGRHHRTERVGWCAMATGFAVAVVGNLHYSLVTARTPGQAFPSVGDLATLLAFLPVGVGLMALLRARAPRSTVSSWLDGVVGALGVTALAVALLPDSSQHLSQGGLATAVALAYPLAGILLLALLGVVGGVMGLRGDRSVALLVAGITVNLAGDIVYVAMSATGTFDGGGFLDLPFVAGVTLVALAAHVSRPGSPSPRPRAEARVGWRVMTVPLACNAASLLVLVAGSTGPGSGVARWCAVGCIATSLARSVVTFRELREFHTVRDQARTDELTGLPNRRALLHRAARTVAAATADRPAALLLLDLDGFKDVNDSLGHQAGDALLEQVGPRLQQELGPGDLLARLGGDEFAVLLPDATLDQAQAQADRIRQLLLQPFSVEGIRLHVGASIGVATAPVPAATVEEMLRCADVAMYSAKASRDGVHAYVPEPHGGSSDRLRTMEELRTALQDDELLIHLQPQVDLAGGGVAGVEALVRWQHPVRGLLHPCDLLPAAEQAGLMRPLTDTVLELALGAATRWWSSDPVPVSVNLAAANVTDLDLPGKVLDALRRHGLPAAALTLELVEDTLMADPERGRQVLAELRGIGVRTSIDDYGTGYSSLAYLRHLPADELKLDRSLTGDAGSDVRAGAIVEHTAALAHALGLRLVAEGVEDDATGEALRRLGCDVAQGYAIARPMPVADFLVWLRARRSAFPRALLDR